MQLRPHGDGARRHRQREQKGLQKQIPDAELRLYLVARYAISHPLSTHLVNGYRPEQSVILATSLFAGACRAKPNRMAMTNAADGQQQEQTAGDPQPRTDLRRSMHVGLVHLRRPNVSPEQAWPVAF